MASSKTDEIHKMEESLQSKFSGESKLDSSSTTDLHLQSLPPIRPPPAPLDKPRPIFLHEQRASSVDRSCQTSTPTHHKKTHSGSSRKRCLKQKYYASSDTERKRQISSPYFTSFEDDEDLPTFTHKFTPCIWARASIERELPASSSNCCSNRHSSYHPPGGGGTLDGELAFRYKHLCLSRPTSPFCGFNNTTSSLLGESCCSSSSRRNSRVTGCGSCDSHRKTCPCCENHNITSSSRVLGVRLR